MIKRIESFLDRQSKRLLFGRNKISPSVSYAEFDEAWTLYFDLTGQALPKKINCSSCVIDLYNRLDRVIHSFQQSYKLKEDEQAILVSLENKINNKIEEKLEISSGITELDLSGKTNVKMVVPKIKIEKVKKPIKRKTKKKKIVKKINKINGKEKPSA